MANANIGQDVYVKADLAVKVYPNKTDDAAAQAVWKDAEGNLQESGGVGPEQSIVEGTKCKVVTKGKVWGMSPGYILSTEIDNETRYFLLETKDVMKVTLGGRRNRSKKARKSKKTRKSRKTIKSRF